VSVVTCQEVLEYNKVPCFGEYHFVLFEYIIYVVTNNNY